MRLGLACAVPNLTVWVLAIFDKVALTLTAFGYQTQGGIADTATTITWDGSLAVVLIVAFILALAEGRAATPSPARS
ncbi:MAG TPA: hypothetical protein VGN81_39575 [Pseudonocardiaceae bacterium]